MKGIEAMGIVFSVQDRQNVFDYILSVASQCDKIVSLVQVGSGANGFHDERSDLDFVIALDSGESMSEVMEYMRRETPRLCCHRIVQSSLRQGHRLCCTYRSATGSSMRACGFPPLAGSASISLGCYCSPA